MVSEKDINLDYMLFTPGPVHVPDFILDIMGKPNDTHRGKFYQQLHSSIRPLMQKLLETENEILIFPSSGTGIMEACVRNLLKDDETGLFFSCGAFGDRWAKIAEQCGKRYKKVKVEEGKAITPDLVKKELGGGDYPVVFITYNETSTGITNPLEEIAPVVKESGAILCVDCVSAMAGIPIKVDEWGIDVALASVQKAFGIPPGIAVCSISERALKKAEDVPNKGVYLNFLEIYKRGLKNECPVTPAIPQIRALLAALEKIIEKGPENVYREQKERTEMIRKWALEHGFNVFGDERYRSNTVVTIENTKNIDVNKFVNELMKRGYRIVNGYGSLKNKTFRIAAMGWYTKEDVRKMLDAASEVLEAL